MSLNTRHMRLTKHGTVTIDPEGSVQIVLEGFEADGASSRDLAVMAQLWAIGILQRSIAAELEEPGAGSAGIIR